jgi:hypothetical protein
MAFDQHTNFAYSRVTQAPTPSTTGTVITITPGDGDLFPAVPFNALVWPKDVQPVAGNAELVRLQVAKQG